MTGIEKIFSDVMLGMILLTICLAVSQCILFYLHADYERRPLPKSLGWTLHATAITAALFLFIRRADIQEGRNPFSLSLQGDWQGQAAPNLPARPVLLHESPPGRENGLENINPRMFDWVIETFHPTTDLGKINDLLLRRRLAAYTIKMHFDPKADGVPEICRQWADAMEQFSRPDRLFPSAKSGALIHIVCGARDAAIPLSFRKDLDRVMIIGSIQDSLRQTIHDDRTTWMLVDPAHLSGSFLLMDTRFNGQNINGLEIPLGGPAAWASPGYYPVSDGTFPLAGLEDVFDGNRSPQGWGIIPAGAYGDVLWAAVPPRLYDKLDLMYGKVWQHAMTQVLAAWTRAPSLVLVNSDVPGSSQPGKSTAKVRSALSGYLSYQRRAQYSWFAICTGTSLAEDSGDGACLTSSATRREQTVLPPDFRVGENIATRANVTETARRFDLQLVPTAEQKVLISRPSLIAINEATGKSLHDGIRIQVKVMNQEADPVQVELRVLSAAAPGASGPKAHVIAGGGGTTEIAFTLTDDGQVVY